MINVLESWVRTRFFIRSSDCQNARKESPSHLPGSGDFWLGNSPKGGCPNTASLPCPNRRTEKRHYRVSGLMDTCCLLAWHRGLWRCPELILLDAALLPHTEQCCSTNPARTSQGPAYLPMGLTGDLIGVAQNFQLHVRLKDPASGRRKIEASQ